MRKIVLLLVFYFLQANLFAQKVKIDSMNAMLASEKTDTGKVKLMWQLANMINVYDPPKALILTQQALNLAVKIKYIDGQSNALGVFANTFIKIGNYPKALEFNLRKLQLEEKRNNPRSLAFALLNTGIVYRYQEDFQQALRYYYRSDSVFSLYHLDHDRYFSMMNLGDVYDKLNNTDSAFSYFNQSLVLSNTLNNEDYIGNAMTGLGHIYRKKGNIPFSLLHYRTAITHLQAANDDEVICEATLGLATLFQQQNNKDSAVHYAKTSLALATQDGFMSKQLDAAHIITDIYKKENNVDSAFVYLSKVQVLNDSVNSRSRIRELQVMSINEKLRQLEIEENKKIAQHERKKQLQYLFIGIFIPGFFLLTLLLSRIRIHTRVIKILGILSLLILFEYLTLLLHPTVAALTNYTPVIEMLIFVSFAAILIPAHHRIEGWLIQKLTHHNDGSIRIKKVKMKVKNPSE